MSLLCVPPDKKKPGASPRRTTWKLQTQQADSVACDTDDEEANDDPQWVN
ncbi:hypothetical protein GQF59_31895, partial [Escherichia coli]|nr:hypothetical protein [Escherichia coli]